MKSTSLIVIALLCGAAAVSLAGTPLPDGSFEQGPPPASGWTEASDHSCEWIGDHSGTWYVSAYDGTQDFWAAGYCLDDVSGENVPVSTSVSQSLTVPADSSVLSFYYIAFRTAGDDVPADGDRAYIAVNGAEVWTLPLTSDNNTYPSWVGPVTVDLAAWGGQAVTLSLGGVSVGADTGNLRFDLLTFEPSSTPVEGASWGALKALYR